MRDRKKRCSRCWRKLRAWVTYVCPYESAAAYLSIGDTARAMTLLDEAVANRSNCLMFLRNDPRLQPLRQQPHFQVLLNRVGLDDVSVASYKR